MRRILLFVSVLSLFACSHPNLINQAKVGKIKRVVILGNSIVLHPALPAIGWDHNWGMAASAQDSDFVHRLIREIQLVSAGTKVGFRNVADFERNFATYDFHELDSLKGADMYIMRLSENVPDGAVGFIGYYDKLINYLNTSGGVVVIVDGFWDKKLNNEIKEFAHSRGYPFILNSDLQAVETNTAAGLYSNSGVAAHPSDKGMLAISNRIWDYIKVYF